MRGRVRIAVLVAVSALVVLAAGTGAPAQGPGEDGCQVQDVSGVWQGFFTGEVNQGEVQLIITQRHRRFHVTALANGVVLAEGDGTIAESGRSHFNGEGLLIKKITAGGNVQGECFATSAEFSYTAEYLDGTRDSGMVVLPVHVPACTEGCEG
jgi:hypothetical protein